MVGAVSVNLHAEQTDAWVGPRIIGLISYRIGYFVVEGPGNTRWTNLEGFKLFKPKIHNCYQHIL